ncbi:MAG: hypothetical protein UR98_C0007G0024 [Parcubacteria group bacterium GW2011_GWA1_36_12]|nr:MAG: hypothetical protein UR98_C0007G0024 [Parcubacteria group bacterium GW2011_GWA1_36_12]
MRQKIYDIKPPRLAHKTEKRRGQQKKEKRFPWGAVLSGAGVLVIIAAVYLFFKLPRADIKIWPKVETLSFEQEITADKSADSVDLSLNVIPAEYFQEEKTESQEFLATGNASNEGKATGTITIYNKYDPPSPITLKAGTHFLSDSGKYFVTLQKTTIPAGKKSGGKITPGSVKVKIEAAEGGEGYNIGPATFSVPKLSGTSYYYSVYAQSTEQMTGGYAGKVKKVIDDDIQQAKEALTKKLISNTEASLKSKISSDYILIDSAISSEVISASTNTKSGALTDKFTYQAAVKSTYLAFKKSDLDEFAKDYIISQMEDSKTMLTSSLKTDYTVKSLDIDNGKITLNLNFSSRVYQNINKNVLIPLLTNKNRNQINEVINNKLRDEVSNVKVNLWPFWVTKSPKSQKAVKIELKFE